MCTGSIVGAIKDPSISRATSPTTPCFSRIMTVCKCWLACTAFLLFFVSRGLLVEVCRFERATAVPCVPYFVDCASPHREAVSVLTHHSPARTLVPTCKFLVVVLVALLVFAFTAPLSALVCACTPLACFLLLWGICYTARVDSRSGLSFLRDR